jgi:hypothetical protein
VATDGRPGQLAGRLGRPVRRLCLAHDESLSAFRMPDTPC